MFGQVISILQLGITLFNNDPSIGVLSGMIYLQPEEMPLDTKAARVAWSVVGASSRFPSEVAIVLMTGFLVLLGLEEIEDESGCGGCD